MATPTQLDIINAVQYLTNRETLTYIHRWRNKFPHILLDYTIRWANNNDFYVPPALRNKSAIIVQLFFSHEGCDSMSCFPYTETGVIDYLHSPLGGYTQTSNTAVQYNQPACFNLDPSLASRDGNIQSVELRYTKQNQCILVDSFTKAWLNAPYIRTSKHVVRGVDDVPGFDVEYDDDPNFPERIKGNFNEAYCRRFGREFDSTNNNNACRQPWYEIFISFILGESVLTTFKLATSQVFDDLRNFDYKKPSAILRDAPEPEGITMLEEWLSIRDSTYDFEKENEFSNNIFNINVNQQIVYKANQGFSIVSANIAEDIHYPMELLLKIRTSKIVKHNANNKNHDSVANDLETIIIEFLQDHLFIMGILTDLGFNVLESTLTTMLQQINKILIPSLKRMLLMQSRRMTVALMGETYKSAVIHALNRAFITTVTTVAKATVRAVKAAASLANLALTFLTIADLVLMIWDPFGYNNMFPRGYLDDLSTAFLSAYYEQIDAPTRDIVQFLPQHFSNMVIDDEEDYFTDSMLHLADYLAVLDVNSNGQIIDLTIGEEINDFDEEELVGASLATNDTWAFFKWFCARHDAFVINPTPYNNIFIGLGLLTCVGSLIYYKLNYTKFSILEKLHMEVLIFLIFLLLIILTIVPSLQYFSHLINHHIVM